ncbi:diacylglycerol kinase family protein [Nocardioides sp.]|uniref:diacylglycerol/lipid kinase family protein n=1 Tax=Nocardioides sp. TaxID=35761 RepID=UPI00351524EE
MEPLLVLTHAGAGNTDAAHLDAALEVLRAHCSVEVATTADPGELDGVLHRAGSRRLVGAGGDGSLHAVVAALHRRRDLASAVLGLLPLGTGNDFARGLGLPLDPAEAALVVATGVPTPMDLLVDELGGVVVNHVHLGASAEASRRGEVWKERLGRLGYPIGAALVAWRPPTFRLHVEVDGETVVDVDSPVLLVAVGNGPSVGGGTALTPEADPGDGVLDVLVTRARGPLARLRYAAMLGLAAHESLEEVSTFRGRRVTVSGEAFWISADGEITGPERHRTWHLERAAYRMLLPTADA